MPVSGTVEEVNQSLADEPEILNGESAETEGWLMEVTLKSEEELEKLMDKDQYEKYLEELE
jgi:glycine cleavage system H protein